METHMVEQDEFQGNAPRGDRLKRECSLIMKAILATFFVIAFIFLTIQSGKIAYQGWLGKRESVLTKYEKSREVEELSQYSIAELTRKYEAARNAVQAYESDEKTPAIEMSEREETEPYATEVRLKAAVEQKESHESELHELRYYCLLGVGLVIVGTLCFSRFNQLIGISMLISGFGEMIGYTTPHSWGSGEFHTILVCKLGFSLVAMALLLLSAYLTGVFSVERMRRANHADEAEGSDQE